MQSKEINRTVLVLGATGNQGGAVARQMLDTGCAVRAMTRKPESEKARELARMGAEIVQGDLNDTRSLEQALKGVWGVFAVFTMAESGVRWEEEQGKRFAELARDKGVRHYVYSSVASAGRKTGIPHFESKWQIEETVRGLGFPSHVILRPAFFMENFLGPMVRPGLEQGRLVMPLKPSTRLQMIAVEDIGKFARLAFDKFQQLNRSEIDLAGDEKTMLETADILSRELGREIKFEQIPDSELRKTSPDMATMFEWFDRVGLNADIPALVKKHGLQPMTLKQWAAKVKWPMPAHR